MLYSREVVTLGYVHGEEIGPTAAGGVAAAATQGIAITAEAVRHTETKQYGCEN